MGKLAHDNEALGSADTVNDAVVLRQFMTPAFASASLIRGDLLIMRCRVFGCYPVLRFTQSIAN